MYPTPKCFFFVFFSVFRETVSSKQFRKTMKRTEKTHQNWRFQIPSAVDAQTGTTFNQCRKDNRSRTTKTTTTTTIKAAGPATPP